MIQKYVEKIEGERKQVTSLLFTSDLLNVFIEYVKEQDH